MNKRVIKLSQTTRTVTEHTIMHNKNNILTNKTDHVDEDMAKQMRNDLVPKLDPVTYCELKTVLCDTRLTKEAKDEEKKNEKEEDENDKETEDDKELEEKEG